MPRKPKDLWLPCDQTIQCALCGWVDWREWDGRHHEFNPKCQAGIQDKRIAELEAKVNSKNKIVEEAVKLYHSGYDGPMMSEAITPLYTAIIELEKKPL